MTILPWPIDPTKRATAPSPDSPLDGIIRMLVADIPGPPNETADQRAKRMEAQFAEAKAMNPRDGAEAMLAVQCILIGLMIADSAKDANRPDLEPALRRAASEHARSFEALLKDSRKLLKICQHRPMPARPAAAAPTPLSPPAAKPAPRRKEDVHLIEEARSGVIVPLHPAPKMLQ
jgi:hypothetical protein